MNCPYRFLSNQGLIKMSLENEIKQLKEMYFVEKRGKVYRSLKESMERALIKRVLERTGGNQLESARILGINRNTLRKKIRKLGLDLKC